MRKSIAVLLVAGLVLSGCNSWRNARVNPSNWFGSSQSTTVADETAGDALNPLIPQKAASGAFSRPEAEDTSVLVASVTEMRIERTPTGAIIYANGLASRQGAFEVDLRRSPTSEANILEYEMRLLYPKQATFTGSELSRTVRAAVSLTNQDLAGITLIRISGRENARETRRK